MRKTWLLWLHNLTNSDHVFTNYLYISSTGPSRKHLIFGQFVLFTIARFHQIMYRFLVDFIINFALWINHKTLIQVHSLLAYPKSREVVAANLSVPRELTVVWGVWMPWTSCTTTCGEGSRIRYRVCNPEDHNCTGLFANMTVNYKSHIILSSTFIIFRNIKWTFTTHMINYLLHCT